MAIKIYGVAVSTCTKRVITTLLEKEVPYELITLDWSKAEHKQPEHLRRHPFGKIPVLEDDGYFVFESRAICKYIAKKFAGQGTKLIPDSQDDKGYGLFEQACSIETSYFNTPAEGIADEKAFKAYRGETADEALVVKYVAKLDAALATYDTILSKQAYLAGNDVSLADLFHLPYGQLAKDLGHKDLFEKYPNVDRWFQQLQSRASWVQANSATL